MQSKTWMQFISCISVIYSPTDWRGILRRMILEHQVSFRLKIRLYPGYSTILEK